MRTSLLHKNPFWDKKRKNKNALGTFILSVYYEK